MPARTGNTTYIPGRGAMTTKPSGKKTFVGNGPAPAGATKLPEPSATEVPTVTVTSSGARATGFNPRRSARQALRAQRASRLRTKAILQTTRQKPPVKPQLPKRPIQKVIAQDKLTFAKEQGPKAPPIKMSKLGTVPKVKPLTAAEVHPRAAKRVKAQLQKLKSSGKSAHLPYLETPEQQKVAKTVLRTGQKMHADRKEKLAAAETGLVESSFKNLPIGAESSGGWRQERGIYYPEPTNVKKGAKNFFTETKTDTGGARGKGQTPGQLAQTVQASAYPERYDEHATEARRILHAFNRGAETPGQKAQLKRVEAKAERLGINPKAPNVGKPSRQTIQKFKAAVKTMGAINSKNFPYVWGGGHGSFSGPYDCSGAISAMIHSVAPNRIKAPLVSGSMGEVLKPGPGAITVFYNSVHTFAYIPSLHKYWGTSESNAGGGAGFFPKSVGDSEVASGNSAGAYNVGHVPGLGKKEAFQLGATDLGSAQSFPGMSVSPSGTTATIESGAGTTQSKPGFSSSPIRLTRGQIVAKTTRKLKALGVGGEEASSAPSTSISELERKYGQRAV